ncbi:glycosyltransferase [Carnobacterium maltaromaticum]|uniref:glycosyltransferase n=1 Tax=Carnobacterium maltaromaticum TaxID=2751 RepID=UPI00295EC271|nr:glycosyltransferase [Carnobacterium maltaromaticum]
MNACTGIITYNPDINRLYKNFSIVKGRTDKIIIIDNGSENILDIKKIFTKEENIEIICFEKNMGIAYALMKLIEIADMYEYHWCLTLDQDTICDPEIVNIYTNFIKKLSAEEINEIGMLAPKIIDRNVTPYNEISKYLKEENLNIQKAITSGSFQNVQNIRKVGNYKSDLFIDYVDNDISAKLILNGYKIISMNNTFIYHEVGNIKVRKFFYRKINILNHSSFRKYYQVRNKIYFIKSYRKTKISITYVYKSLCAELFKVVFFEDEKSEKLKAMARGFLDGVKYKNKFKT